jgi:aspartyl-tRNA(Asn)/glutamyl-tRNA(Gln) amidotransferase subunit B
MENDYRYFPEPDLRPLHVQSWLKDITLPELPDARRERFVQQYGCSLNHARTLTGELKMANFYEAVVSGNGNELFTLAATWIADTLAGELNYRGMGIDAVDAKKFTGLLILLKAGTITDKSGVEVLRVMLDEHLKGETAETPDAIVSRLNLAKTSGDDTAHYGCHRRSHNGEPKSGRGLPGREERGLELPCRPDHEKDPGARRSRRAQPADDRSPQEYGAVT